MSEAELSQITSNCFPSLAPDIRYIATAVAVRTFQKLGLLDFRLFVLIATAIGVLEKMA
jgi:hypothetical protein